MKSFAILAGLSVSAVIAQPHGHSHGHRHQHEHLHEKRAVVTEWTTQIETVTVTEYVDSTTTTWITPANSASTTLTSTTTAVSSRSTVPGQFFEGASTSSRAAAATTSQEVPPAADPYVAPPASSSTSASVYTPPPPPPAAPTTTPATSTVVQQNQQNTGSSSSGSATKHHGDLTYYDVGMGACGWDDSGKDFTENIVALSHLVMGTQSNGNPYCGKSISISYGGKTIQAIVRDKCMGCEPEAIDVSKCAFVDLMGSMEAGRKAVDWWYN